LRAQVEVTGARKPAGDRDRDGPVPYAGRASRKAITVGWRNLVRSAVAAMRLDTLSVALATGRRCLLLI